MILIFSISLILTIIFVYMPYQRAMAEQTASKFNQKYHVLKLWAVKKYYPSLAELSNDEILSRYNLDSIYDNIGKNLRRD